MIYLTIDVVGTLWRLVCFASLLRKLPNIILTSTLLYVEFIIIRLLLVNKSALVCDSLAPLGLNGHF